MARQACTGVSMDWYNIMNNILTWKHSVVPGHCWLLKIVAAWINYLFIVIFGLCDERWQKPIPKDVNVDCRHVWTSAWERSTKKGHELIYTKYKVTTVRSIDRNGNYSIQTLVNRFNWIFRICIHFRFDCVQQNMIECTHECSCNTILSAWFRSIRLTLSLSLCLRIRTFSLISSHSFFQSHITIQFSIVCQYRNRIRHQALVVHDHVSVSNIILNSSSYLSITSFFDLRYNTYIFTHTTKFILDCCPHCSV